MKKTLFLALLTALLLLLAATTALAESPSDYICTTCGEPCTRWLPMMETATKLYHVPCCDSCGNALYEHEFLCTPVEGTATCVGGNMCSVCGQPDNLNSAPDPNAHDWYCFFINDHEHYRECDNGCGAQGNAPHYGGTATCTQRAVCEGCHTTYGELDPNDHDWGDWVWFTGNTHLRECRDCPASEEGKHTGGTATCITHAICEVCTASYGELDYTRHGEYSGWSPYDGTRHYSWCLDCSAPTSIKYEDHYGGTATCVTQAFCEGCNQPYGPYGDHANMSGWIYDNEAQHFRYCQDCGNPVSYEYAAHTGGDGSCLPVCEECDQRYIDENGKHSNMCDWFYNDAAQHRRHCLACGTYESNEYEDHYGGTATCTQRAVCEGCGTEYGEYSDVHPWGEWEYLDDTSHQRRCTNSDCYTSDYADHSGGDGSCRPICEVCGWTYLDNDGKHGEMSKWWNISGTQHFRHCLVCGHGKEYAPHSGGTATCVSQAVCEGCDARYGEPDSTRHGDYTDWAYHSDTQHRRICLECGGYYEYEDHYGGTATCVDLAICEGCGTGYGEPSTNHTISEWKNASFTQHRKYCILCWSPETISYEDHYGGTATCTERAICEGCGVSYGELSTEHPWSEWSWISDTEHSRICPVCYEEESASHHGGDGSCMPTCEDCKEIYLDSNGEHTGLISWRSSTDTTHFRFCVDCGNGQEYAPHYGGTATCYLLAVCEGCGWEYGEYAEHGEYTRWKPYDENHHYKHCVECGANAIIEGHTGGTATCSIQALCADCGSYYGDIDPDAHEWGDWFPDENGTHFRICGLNGEHIEFGSCTGDSWVWLNDEYHGAECDDCGGMQVAEHTGGTATCSSRAICEGCGSSYGDFALDVHLHMSEWRPHADGHERHCLDCNLPTSFERAPHTGDGACVTTCIDCHESFIDPNGEHSLTDWLPENDTQHVRYCEICQHNDTYEYADHVGDGTCTSECKDCGITFTDPDGTHRLTQWSASSPKKHIRYCPDCQLEFTFESGEHRPNANAEDLPCYKTITCTDCGYNMGFGTQHSLSGWVPYSPLQHMRYCTVGGVSHVAEYDLHYGGDGSCMPVCEGCGEAYIPLSGTHQWGEWTPNADGTHTRVCALNADHTETADCTWGDWTHLTHIHHERRCTVCNAQELGEHTGGTLTCYSPRICEVCNEGYGSPDNSGLSGHPNPTIEVKPSTCYDEGYYRVTCDHPGCSMPFFEIILPANGQHLYNHWDIRGDNMHHTDCAQCGENTDVACTLWELYEGETLLTVCPVCGDFAEALFEVLLARDDAAVPIGTLLVRGLADPIDGALFGFTVAGVYGGEVVDIHGPVTITIPVECEGFTVVRVEIVDDAEVRTEIPFTLNNGQLTIETATAGLFLLVPAE